MDWTTIAVAVITALGAFLGTYLSNRKQTALMAYRIEQLEKKVEKLEERVNALAERTGKQ